MDVFFVLSGFLITSIILRDIREGSFSLKEFYLRRIQRLLPNAAVTILVVLIIWALFLPASAAGSTGVHGLWTLLNLSNVYAWRNLGGYWGNAAESAPLTHFWSLGIEEQFYLLFPGCLLLLIRFQPRWMRPWLIAATVFSFGLCLYGTYAHPRATFYLLPTRVWELLLGGVLAAHRAPVRLLGDRPWVGMGARTRETLGWTGLGLIATGFFVVGEGDGFPGWAALAPTVGTAMVLLSVADGETRVSCLLSTPFIVTTGRLSYSLYLWHWPLIIFGKVQADILGLPILGGAAAGGIVAILLAAGAYLGVERPLRKRGPGRPWRLGAIVGLFLMAALGCGLVAGRRAVPDPHHRFDTPAFYGRLFDAGHAAGSRDLVDSIWYSDTRLPPMPESSPDAWRRGGIVHLFGGGVPKVVVLGSSHAMMYSRLIDDICREMHLSVAYLSADDATPAFFETPGQWMSNPNFASYSEAHEFDEARKRWLREWRPEAVFVIDRWDSWVGRPQSFEAKLHFFLKDISPSSGRILFVTQIPVIEGASGFNLREFVNWRMRGEKDLPRLKPDANEPRRKLAVAAAEAAAADFPNLRVLRADRLFYRHDGSVRYAEGRTLFYADDNHLTDSGSEVVRGLFLQAITEAHLAAAPR